MYDVIIVGAGPAGLYGAYEYALKNPNFKVLMIDRGLDITKRRCPILEGKLKKCPVNTKGYAGCYPACSITSGLVVVEHILMVSLILLLSLVVG